MYIKKNYGSKIIEDQSGICKDTGCFLVPNMSRNISLLLMWLFTLKGEYHETRDH